MPDEMRFTEVGHVETKMMENIRLHPLSDEGKTATAADPVAVAMLPHMYATSHTLDALPKKQFAICTNEFEEGSLLVTLPCHKHHVFHLWCVRKWLNTMDACPLCRAAVPRDDRATLRGIQPQPLSRYARE
jgi:hypothetical protein